MGANNILEKAAEILVECGYANSYYMYHDRYFWEAQNISKLKPYLRDLHQQCNPFSDTLEGRRQADAIEDWLGNNKSDLWSAISKSDSELYEMKGFVTSAHQWRLDRIKWCLESL